MKKQEVRARIVAPSLYPKRFQRPQSFPEFYALDRRLLPLLRDRHGDFHNRDAAAVNNLCGKACILCGRRANCGNHANLLVLWMPGNIPYEPRSRSGSRRVRGKKRSHRFLGGIEPTDVISVWKAGADFVKVFPCAPVGGASYIRALKAPLLRVPLIASGGVHQQTALNFVVAGATALGIGAELIPRESVQLKQEDRILELARWFTRIVKDARRPEH